MFTPPVFATSPGGAISQNLDFVQVAHAFSVYVFFGWLTLDDALPTNPSRLPIACGLVRRKLRHTGKGGTSVKRDGSRERSQRGRGGGQWPHHQHHRPHHRPLPPPRRLWLPTQGDRQFFLSHRGVRSKPRLMLRRPSRCSLTSLASNLGRLSCSSGGDHSRAGQRNGKFETTPLSAFCDPSGTRLITCRIATPLDAREWRR